MVSFRYYIYIVDIEITKNVEVLSYFSKI